MTIFHSSWAGPAVAADWPVSDRPHLGPNLDLRRPQPIFSSYFELIRHLCGPRLQRDRENPCFRTGSPRLSSGPRDI
jgi:hypothetical protein